MKSVYVVNRENSKSAVRFPEMPILMPPFRQRAIYLKFVGPVEHLIVSEEEVSDED